MQIGDACVDHGVVGERQRVGHCLRGDVCPGATFLHMLMLTLLFLLEDQLTVVEYVIEGNTLVGRHAQDGPSVLQLALVFTLVKCEWFVDPYQCAEL